MREASDHASDERLALRFLAGDQSAFEQLVLRYQNPVHRFVCWMVDENAEDLTQDIFVEVHRSLATWRHRSSFRTWIYGVARNVCRRHLRDEGTRRRFWGQAEHEPVDSGPGPLQRLDDSEQNRALLEAIANLSAAQRVTLMLRAWEGMSYDEIAAVTAVPKGTVRSRLHAARQSLAKTLDKV